MTQQARMILNIILALTIAALIRFMTTDHSPRGEQWKRVRVNRNTGEIVYDQEWEFRR